LPSVTAAQQCHACQGQGAHHAGALAGHALRADV
jgi:hypothetical protein